MKQIQVKALTHNGEMPTLDEVGKLLEEQTSLISIDTVNWSEYGYKPEVKARIGYWGKQIWIKFYVREKNILARTTSVNGDVYKDSCVEFFLSPRDNGYYYNFEFNCIGTPHVGYGGGRHNREHISPFYVNQIQRKSSLGDLPFGEQTGDFSWDLTVVIPKSVFVNDVVANFSGLESKGNFYKCGDETSDPHFVTWNPIDTETPDYHQYSSFGSILFE
ncbi:MAG: carbohydrate-binding family 9-like protein [Bacteroidota bacterium]|nr:carbohydrate-binding family 9-like protein [Bacteroidota bacterium]